MKQDTLCAGTANIPGIDPHHLQASYCLTLDSEQAIAGYVLQCLIDDANSSKLDKGATDHPHQFADSSNTLGQMACQPLLPMAQRSDLLRSIWCC